MVYGYCLTNLMTYFPIILLETLRWPTNFKFLKPYGSLLSVFTTSVVKEVF
jgi:hypothetical protein